MKLKLSLGLSLLLTGCQMTPEPILDDVQNHEDETVQNVDKNQTLSDQASTVLAKKPSFFSPRPKVKVVKEKAKTVTPQSQEDVWQRISMQFSLEVPDNKLIAQHRQWFLKHPRHLQSVAQRAEPFLYLITEKIEERNLPLELALLPIVESSFDVRAYSHGQAAGLWQFLSGTAKMYGLEQDYWYDGRRDVSASTDAALDYLEYLNKYFDGNWYHAIAAYNSGEGRVGRAIKSNIKANKPTDFFSLSLPKETSRYVPKLLALADVLSNRDKYGIKIPKIANKPYLKLIEPNEQLDLRIAANYAGIDHETMRDLNPAYNQWATSPKGTQQLLIPLSSESQFNKMLEENRGKGVQFAQYKVKSGDTLSTIAARNNIPTSSLKETNSLKRNLIRVGQTLLIPNAGAKTIESLDQITEANLSNNLVVKNIAYKVKRGDTLSTIAQRNDITTKDLKQTNNLSRNTIRIGQTLQIPTLVPAPISKVDKIAAVSSSYTQAKKNNLTYKVKSGDTLSTIAARNHISTTSLKQENNLKGNVIRVGQTLQIPSTGSVSINSLEQLTAAAPVEKIITHTVKNGDTLWDLAKKYNVSHKAIAKVNNIKSTATLRLGQKVIIKQQLDEPVQKTVSYKVKSGDTLSAIAMRFNLKSSDIMKWNKLSNQAILKIGQTLTLYVDIDNKKNV